LADDRALPAADFGPVLARAFWRLTEALRVVVMLHAFCPPVASIRLQLPPLRDVALANSESVSLRLTIGGIAASLHGHDHAIDTRENVDVHRDNARYVIVQCSG
jgi:hypothetical protein